MYGGHDCEFIGAVSDRLNCNICTKVLRDPHLAVCCGQHFCGSCLNEWFTRQGKESCPHCRAEGEAFHHVIHKGLRSEINQLKIMCSNHGEGCQWTGELGALKEHMESDSGCDFVMVECPNECKEFYGHMETKTSIMRRRDLADHLTQSCYLRPYQCDFCGLKDTYEAITGDSYVVLPRVDKYDYYGHQAECPEAPVTCLYDCGLKMKQKELKSHFSQCPLEPIECPFAEAGCRIDIRRYQLEDHMTSSLQQHLMLLMIDRKQLKGELNEVKTKLTKVETELGEAKLKLSKAEMEIDETKLKLHETESRLTVCEASMCSNSPKKLKNTGDSLELTMPNFSMYCRSGKVWHSPPFYYREGYKMCLTVYANSPGGTHINVALLLLKGEYDNQLRWPNMSCGHRHCMEHTQESYEFFVCGSLQQPQVNECKQLDCCNHFCSLESWSLRRKLTNDSLIFKTEYGKCFIKVKIV